MYWRRRTSTAFVVGSSSHFWIDWKDQRLKNQALQEIP